MHTRRTAEPTINIIASQGFSTPKDANNAVASAAIAGHMVISVGVDSSKEPRTTARINQKIV